MIKFFRHIRKSMVEKNRTKKYILYAIGEIILVVIGILLALQINTWSNNAQQKSQNKISLHKMLLDLESTIVRLDRIVYKGRDNERYQYPSIMEALAVCDSLLSLSYKGFEEKHFDFIVNADTNAGNSLLNVNDNTYQEMLNTGRIYGLKSDALTSAITNYYKKCERESIYNIQNSRVVNEGYTMMESGFGKMFMDYELNKEHFDLNNYPFYFQPKSKEYQDYQLALRRFSGQRFNMIKFIFIIEETEKLIKLIENELENYD